MLEHWVSGEPTIINDRHAVLLSGKYDLTVGDDAFVLSVDGETAKWQGTIEVNDAAKISVKLA